MLEAEPAPLRRAIGAATALLGRRAKLAGFRAARMGAGVAIAFDAAVKPRVAPGLLRSAKTSQNLQNLLTPQRKVSI
jgi:hypothetical protein